MEEKEKTEEKSKALIKARSIFLSGHIDEASAKIVIENLIRMEKDSPLEDIELYIDSYGGFIDSMFAIIDTMNLIHCDIKTICVGKAISAAAIILSSGAKGKRIITPNARTMIHQLWAFSFGTASEIETGSKEIKRLQNLMEKTLAKNTRKSQTQIKEDMKKALYMSAEESIKYGLVDKINK